MLAWLCSHSPQGWPLTAHKGKRKYHSSQRQLCMEGGSRWASSHLYGCKPTTLREMFWAMIVWWKKKHPSSQILSVKASEIFKSPNSPWTQNMSVIFHYYNQNPWQKQLKPESFVLAWDFSGCSPFWQRRHWGGNDCLPRWEQVVEGCSDHRGREAEETAWNREAYNLQSLPAAWPTYASQAPPPNGSTTIRTAPEAGSWEPAGDISDLNNNSEFQ